MNARANHVRTMPHVMTLLTHTIVHVFQDTSDMIVKEVIYFKWNFPITCMIVNIYVYNIFIPPLDESLVGI